MCLAWAGNLIFLLYRLDYAFVEKLCNATELGNYIQVSKIAQLFFILPTILASIIFPLNYFKTCRRNSKMDYSLIKSYIFYLYFHLPGAIVIGYWLFPLIFGASFSDMYLPFVLLIPGILSLSVSFTLTAYFAGIKKLDINIKAALFALFIVVVGNFIAINFYSIRVAAIVSSLAYLTLMIYLISILKKQHQISLAAFFIFKSKDYTDLKNIILNYRK